MLNCWFTTKLAIFRPALLSVSITSSPVSIPEGKKAWRRGKGILFSEKLFMVQAHPTVAIRGLTPVWWPWNKAHASISRTYSTFKIQIRRDKFKKNESDPRTFLSRVANVPNCAVKRGAKNARNPKPIEKRKKTVQNCTKEGNERVWVDKRRTWVLMLFEREPKRSPSSSVDNWLFLGGNEKEDEKSLKLSPSPLTRFVIRGSQVSGGVSCFADGSLFWGGAVSRGCDLLPP